MSSCDQIAMNALRGFSSSCLMSLLVCIRHFRKEPSHEKKKDPDTYLDDIWVVTDEMPSFQAKK